MIGILLHTEEYKGTSQRGIWLTEEGLETTFQRISSKEPTPTPPLLGTSELFFKSQKSSGDAPFIHDWQCHLERRGLCRPYARLQAASYFATFLRENAGILPDPDPVYALATTVFDAMETAQEPLAALFKALYKLALMEGFPVKEDWLLREHPDLAQDAIQILKTPLSSLTLDVDSVTRLKPLLTKLLSWFQHHTEFRLPASTIDLT